MNLLQWVYTKLFKSNIKPKIFSVVITKEHIDQTGQYRFYESQYSAIHDCPLYRAIKQQYPLFPLSSVGGCHLTTTTGKIYSFKDIDDGWDCHKMLAIASGKLNSHTVILKKTNL